MIMRFPSVSTSLVVLGGIMLPHALLVPNAPAFEHLLAAAGVLAALASMAQPTPDAGRLIRWMFAAGLVIGILCQL